MLYGEPKILFFALPRDWRFSFPRYWLVLHPHYSRDVFPSESVHNINYLVDLVLRNQSPDGYLGLSFLGTKAKNGFSL
jgi:hypothetical protein